MTLVAEQLGVSVRTVWDWLKVARTEGRNVRERRARLEVTEADVIDIRPVPAYTPHLKGAIERANGSIETLLLSELPGFLHGARDRAGKLVGKDAPILAGWGVTATSCRGVLR